MRAPLAALPPCVVAIAFAVVGAGSCSFHVDNPGGEGEGEGEGGFAGEGEGGEGEGGEGEGEGGEGEGEGGIVPALGGSSHGTGGSSGGGAATTSDGIDYQIVMPTAGAAPIPLMIVFSGVEGGSTMAQNCTSLAPAIGLDDVMFAVLDGAVYFGNGAAGASVLDDVRAHYDIDNDRTFLLSESAGTSAGLQLGFQLRESYFAAYWANDVNDALAPSSTAAQLGFAPFGNAGPGGDFTDAQTIVDGMRSAGYRIDDPAPYNGTGSGTHGDTNQFIAAMQWFIGRSR